MNFQQRIKDILVDLAANDELPLDMNQLDPSLFDNVLGVDEAKQVLNDNGYPTDSLWQAADVTSHYECSDDEAFEIVDMAIQGDRIMAEINEAIEMEAAQRGLIEKQ